MNTDEPKAMRISDAYRAAIACAKADLQGARSTSKTQPLSWGKAESLRVMAKEHFDQATLIAHLMAHLGDVEISTLTPAFEKQLHEQGRQTDYNAPWRYTYSSAVQVTLRYARGVALS